MASTGTGRIGLKRVIGRERAVVEGHQFGELFGVVLGRHRLARAAHGERSQAVGAGRAAEAEVDAAGMQRLQQAEGLGDLERRVVGQHDPAGADAQMVGAAGDVADHDLGGAAGQAGGVVVFGEPEAVVAEAVGQHGEIARIAPVPAAP